MSFFSEASGRAFGQTLSASTVSCASREDFFVSEASGLLVHHRCWPAASSPPKGHVLLLHGLGEYCARYAAAVAVLNASGFSVVSLDYVGHGRSEGHPRGYFRSMRDLASDVLQLAFVVRPPPPGVPRFLMGHSLGGLVALHVLQACMQLEGVADMPQPGPPFPGVPWSSGPGSEPGWGGWAGLVLSAPALVVDPDLDTALNRAAVTLLCGWLPKLVVDHLNPKDLCTDPAVVDQYVRDPLVAHEGVRARVGMEIMRGQANVRAFAPTIILPVLLVHGELDKLCRIAGSEGLLATKACCAMLA